jgi:drug/metabolite transporter (DMT)-like permease
MSHTKIGLICCLSFVTLEAFQAVYLGTVFQDVDSFLVGTWVFGISVVGCALATAIFRPTELTASRRAWRIVVVLNIFAALTWTTYFIAVQLIEPAVVFTLFSGMVPLGTVVAGWLGLPEALSPKRRLIQFGNALILLSILFLAIITVFGLSGFVRGDWHAALIGVSLSAVSGGCTAFVILYSVRLNSRGVGPSAQFGLRFVLYTFLAFMAFLIGLDDKGVLTPTTDLVWIILIGLVIIAFPLYLVQKAVPYIHASLITAMTALGPAMVFLMQLFDGRVEYSSATLVGLAIYIVGALMAVYGATRSSIAAPLRAET